MNNKASSKGMVNLRYIILLIIAMAVGLVLLLKFGPATKPSPEELEKKAVEHIDTLKGKVQEPIEMEKADHFVGPQTVLEKKQHEIITTTPKALLDDHSVSPTATIKVLLEEDKPTLTTPRELLEKRGLSPHTLLRILKEDGTVTETTLNKLLAEPSITPETPITIIEKREKVLVTTPQELHKRGLTPETPIKVIVEKPRKTVTLSELLPEQWRREEDTFYIHAVTTDDVQGIWGIIQHGLMDQFLKGIPVVMDKDVPTRQVLTLQIPEYADEPLRDGYSSFLGTILTSKTRESYVYNYTTGRMGKNPHYILPGQQIVISRFSTKELVEIYKHFSQKAS